MKALPLKLVFVLALAYGSTSGLSIDKSVKRELKNVDGANVSWAQPEIRGHDEVKTASGFKDQPKDDEPSKEKRNLQLLQEGRGKKKKKIKGVLFLMMVALAVKCIMVLKALTIKALLASKIALVLSLLSIMKKLFEKPDHKPQTNIVLKREPEHHYSRHDMIGRIDDGDIWITDHDDRFRSRRRYPVSKGVFDGWTGRYQRPRGVFSEDGKQLYIGRKSKRKKERPCNCAKSYLLGSLERGKDDLDNQASENEKQITSYEFPDSTKIVQTRKPNISVPNLEGNQYPYSRIVSKNQNSGGRDWNLLDSKVKEGVAPNSRETNINKGMINHYDNDVFKGSDWASINQQKTHATNNGFQNGRSTQVFANWDAYKKFFGHRRSIEDYGQRPSVSDGNVIRDRQVIYNHRLGE